VFDLITKDQIERDAVGSLGLGHAQLLRRWIPIACPDGSVRADKREVILREPMREVVKRLDAQLPDRVIDEAMDRLVIPTTKEFTALPKKPGLTKLK
jgi:hypothetical protein